MTPSAFYDSDAGEDLSCDAIVSSTYLEIKQRKKEEGRRRALEMAMAKQILFNSNGSTNSDKRGNRKSARHGARNQDRHKQFAQWILNKFPHILADCIDVNVDDDQNHMRDGVDDTTTKKSSQRMHVIDVAGGKGELSARLSLCHSLRVMMVDPRAADIESVYMNSVVPKLPKKWQHSIEEKLKHSPSFVRDELEKRFSQLVMPFSSPSYKGAHDVSPSFGGGPLDSSVESASLIIGLHADGATEAIVDAALIHRKPFVVVPCCVFPNLFRERYISIFDEASEVKRIPVRSHDQFCKYLLAKDPRFLMEILPFDGRNVAIWWDGK
ncbi:hypothetical protein ACHAXA_005566 [Cyclostephanos tholiformis]|uniref:Methyltransferase domain-containing protein n=1 Tax=Cyclostephanos tholiformis TaxID=382380 RepID=A0ABD3SGW0_9STRA